jgi:hypothetical protein
MDEEVAQPIIPTFVPPIVAPLQLEYIKAGPVQMTAQESQEVLLLSNMSTNGKRLQRLESITCIYG